MFNREQSSRIKQEFWTAFGRYMNPVPSSEGLKTNWVNYNTGIKEIYFRMDAGPKSATISISIEHPDTAAQELYFEQFKATKKILHNALGETWKWQLHESIDGKVISRIFNTLPDVSVFNKDQWPDLISFFKLRIIALDSFWENAKWGFESSI